MAYDDDYWDELHRLNAAQDKAAISYAAQMLYLREETAGRRITCTPPEVRKRVAEDAAQEWLRATNAIEALNAAEYKRTVKSRSGV